jgi:hypothetical protein
MGLQNSFHAPHGGADFLGWRKTRAGGTEIIYDDGVARRMVWRVAGNDPSEARISEALRVKRSEAMRIVPSLYDELKKAGDCHRARHGLILGSKIGGLPSQ